MLTFQIYELVTGRVTILSFNKVFINIAYGSQKYILCPKNFWNLSSILDWKDLKGEFTKEIIIAFIILIRIYYYKWSK